MSQLELVFNKPVLDKKNKLVVKEPGIRDICLMANSFVQVTIPHCDPKETFVSSRNGDLYLGIQSAQDAETHKHIGVPYGVHPRLLLGYVTTWAHRYNDPHVVIDECFDDFLRHFNFDPVPRSARSPRMKMLEQAEKLFTCSVRIQRKSERGDVDELARKNINVASEYRFYTKTSSGGGHESSASIVLGDEFFKNIIDHPVPIDVNVMRVLAVGGGPGAAMRLDLYSWLAHESWKINNGVSKPRLVTWYNLMDQFGTVYKKASVGNFGAAVKRQLKAISKIHTFKYKNREGGIFLESGSALPIPQDMLKVVR